MVINVNLTFGKEELVSLLEAMGNLGENINVHFSVEFVIKIEF